MAEKGRSKNLGSKGKELTKLEWFVLLTLVIGVFFITILLGIDIMTEKKKDVVAENIEDTETPLMSFSNVKKFTWEEGETVTGIVEDITVEEGKDEGTYNFWSLMTDKGIIKFTLSKSFDEQIRDYVFLGDKIRVISLGKIEFEGGKTFNQFNLDILKIGNQECTIGQALVKSAKAKK